MPTTIDTADIQYALGGNPNCHVLGWSAVSGTGRWYLVYGKSTGWYWATSTDGVAWTTQGVVSGLAGSAASTAQQGVCLDGAGNVYWVGYANNASDGATVLTAYTASGWWPTPPRLPSMFVGAAPNLYESGGTTYLRWARHTPIAQRVTNPTSASTNSSIVQDAFWAPGDNAAGALNIPTDVMGSNFIHVYVDNAATPSLDFQVYAATSQNSNAQLGAAPSILADANLDLNTHATATDGGGVYHVIYRIAGTGWFEATYDGTTWTTGGTLPQIVDGDTFPALMVDNSGTLHLFYCRHNAANDYGIGHISKISGGSWAAQADVVAHNGVNRSNLSVPRKPNGVNTVLVWSEGTASPFNIVAAQVTTGALTPGTASVTSYTATTANLSATAATGGTAPYTYQWYRGTTSGFAPGAGNILTGQTALTLADSGLTTGTPYYYVLVVTDSAGTPATADYNQVSVTPNTPPIVVGTIASVTLTDQAVVIVANASTGGTGTLSYQWHRGDANDFSPSAATLLGGQTALTLTDTPWPRNRLFYYILVTTDQTTPTPQAANSVVQVAQRYLAPLVVGWVGDSITHPASSPPDSAMMTQVVLQKMLGDRLVAISNQAVSGTNASQWLPGGANYTTATSAFASAGVEYVCLLFGVNDSAAGFSAATYQGYVQQIVDGLTGLGYVVVINHPHYIQGLPAQNALMQTYGAALDALENGRTVFVGDRTAKLWFSGHGEEQSDGVHPTQPSGSTGISGMQSFAAMWAAALVRVIDAPGARGVRLNGGI